MKSSPKTARAKFTTWISASKWRERLITFDPSWFVLTMGTGVVIQLLYYFPWPSYWLRNLGYAFWILNIILFSFFTILGSLRLVFYPKVALSVLEDFQQTAYLGAIPISLDTITTGIVLYYNATPAAMYVAEAFYWIGVVMTALVTLGGTFSMYKTQGQHSLDEVNGVWLLAYIPMIVTSALGSTLNMYLQGNNTVTILIVSFLMLSLGLGICFIVITIYFWRLIAHNLPPRDAIVSSFVPVGPLSLGAYSVLNLSLSLAKYIETSRFVFEQTYTQPYNAVSQGAVIQVIIWIGVLSSLTLLGIATFFLIEAVVSVLSKVPKTFSIGWWSFVFPCGVHADAWCRLSMTLRNDGMKGWAATCVVVTVLLWLMCAFLTTYKGVWLGKTFSAPGLQGYVEQQQLEQSRKEYEDKADGETSNGRSTARKEDQNEKIEWQTAPDGTYRRITSTQNGDPSNNV